MKWLLFVYFTLSGVTWVAGKAGVGIMGRLAMPDVAMLVLILAVLLRYGTRLFLPRLAVAGGLLLMAFGPGLLFSADATVSGVEWLVHLYGLVGFFVVYNLVARGSMEQRLDVLVLWVRAGVVLALVGIYDLLAATVGLPGLAASLGQAPSAQGGLVGTFRNTGQAGVFFVTVLATAIPLLRVSTGARRREVVLSITLLVLTTLLSVKRSALLALAFGVVLLMLGEQSWRVRVRSLAVVGVAASIIVPAFLWMHEASPQFRWRISHKLTSSSAVDRVSDFAGENVDAATRAIVEHPLTGVGVGGVAGVYTAKYEIHSTYLSVAASGGLLGIVAYAWFVYVLFRSCTRPRNADPRARVFARATFPLMLGLMLAYAYTYHLRKREFWVAAALASAVMAPIAAPTAAGAPAPRRRRVPEPEPAGVP